MLAEKCNALKEPSKYHIGEKPPIIPPLPAVLKIGAKVRPRKI